MPERIFSEDLLNQNEASRDQASSTESASKKVIDKLKRWLLAITVGASVVGIGVGFDSALAVDIGVALSIFSTAGVSLDLFLNRAKFERVNPQSSSDHNDSVDMGQQVEAGSNIAYAVDVEASAIDLRAATPATSVSLASSSRSLVSWEGGLSMRGR